jgi:hypothetical protein
VPRPSGARCVACGPCHRRRYAIRPGSNRQRTPRQRGLADPSSTCACAGPTPACPASEFGGFFSLEACQKTASVMHLDLGVWPLEKHAFAKVVTLFRTTQPRAYGRRSGPASTQVGGSEHDRVSATSSSHFTAKAAKRTGACRSQETCMIKTVIAYRK